MSKIEIETMPFIKKWCWEESVKSFGFPPYIRKRYMGTKKSLEENIECFNEIMKRAKALYGFCTGKWK